MPRLFSGLRVQLMAIVLLSVLPAFVLILYSGMEERKSAALQAEENTRRLIELASAHQVRVIDDANSLLATISEGVARRISDVGECSAYLGGVLAEHVHYLNLGVIGRDGRILCSALPIEEYADFSESNFFQRALNDGGFTIGSSRFEPTTGKAAINFGYPMHGPDGRVEAVLFSSVDLAWLGDLAAFLKLPEGATLTVIDREGSILVRHPEPERWVGKVVPGAKVLKAALAQNGKGSVETDGLDGVRRLYAFTYLGDPVHSPILYTGIPTDAVYGESNRALTRNLVGLGAVAVLVLSIAYLFGHLVVMRRVNALLGAVSRLAAGDLGARTGIPSGTSELEKLGLAFDAMAESLEKKAAERDRMEVALSESENRYRNLVEQVPVIIYRAALDAARTVLFMSPQVESLLGFEQADFYAGPDVWSRLIHREDRERVLAEVARCMKEGDIFVCEYRMFTFKGNVKWIRDEAAILQDDRGNPLFFQGVMADITERKRVEAELVAARNELEERVEQRTRELARVNEELLQSTAKLKTFAFSVMHDLKSPAIGIYGLTKLLGSRYGGLLDEKGMLYCNQIIKASEHIVALAERINAYIATSETPLNIETVDLKDILNELKEEFATRFAERSIRLIEPEADATVRADRLSLLRAIRNLMDNALKYGGDELSEIRIGYQEADKFHIFSVTDNGRGVSEADAGKIFQIFQRSSSSSKVEGSGLGLSIVKDIAIRLGGSASVEPGADRGVTFSFSISKDL